MLFGQEHVDSYRDTDGQEGHDWQGTQTLLLTTTGRNSGKERTTPLIYGESGNDFVVVASKGGTPDHPAWYLNLQKSPTVEVQIWGDRFRAHARTATPEEKPALWKQMVSRWPAYEDYQARTDREIPVVVLKRE